MADLDAVGVGSLRGWIPVRKNKTAAELVPVKIASWKTIFSKIILTNSLTNNKRVVRVVIHVLRALAEASENEAFSMRIKSKWSEEPTWFGCGHVNVVLNFPLNARQTTACFRVLPLMSLRVSRSSKLVMKTRAVGNAQYTPSAEGGRKLSSASQQFQQTGRKLLWGGNGRRDSDEVHGEVNCE